MTTTVTPVDIHNRMQTELPYFARKAPLQIKGKGVVEDAEDVGDATAEGGALIPFKFNIAQRYIHDKLEEQRAKLGRVRALLLKGRQQGGSTYVAARFYHRTSRNKGVTTFILSHDGQTTGKLFKMVERYHENIHPVLQPKIGASNRNQLVFSGLDSDYSVGTAGNKDVGRGGTAQLFHGSEAAYWENDYEIQKGALESIGDARGTEIILESTANGPKGLFYDKCQVAISDEKREDKDRLADYILIFVPWFWQTEYERPVHKGFELTEEEQKLVEVYFTKPFPYQSAPISLDSAKRKMSWRRFKIVQLATAGNRDSGVAEFKRTYPNNPIEAFRASGVSLFRADAIEAARAAVQIITPVGPLIVGVDPAGESDNADRTVIAIRRGRRFEKFIEYSRMNSMELAGILVDIIKKQSVDMMFIDRGYGQGTIDRMVELKWGRYVQGIAFNQRPIERDIYTNKRSEIIIKFAEWVNGGDVRIPDLDVIAADLASIPVDKKNSNGLKSIPSKDEIKKILKRSTDYVDAGALTFSYPVARVDRDGPGGSQRWVKANTGVASGNGGLRSRARKWGKS